MDAALSLLAEGGAAAVTHRGVARKARVSLGAITYYFGSKRDLLGEVFENHLARIRESVGELASSPVHSPSTALASFLEAEVRDNRLDTLSTLELALERARNPKLRRRLQGSSARSEAQVLSFLRQLGSATPEADTTLLIAALIGLKLEWLAEGERSAFAARVPELTRRLSELLLAGADRRD